MRATGVRPEGAEPPASREAGAPKGAQPLAQTRDPTAPRDTVDARAPRLEVTKSNSYSRLRQLGVNRQPGHRPLRADGATR